MAFQVTVLGLSPAAVLTIGPLVNVVLAPTPNTDKDEVNTPLSESEIETLVSENPPVLVRV